MSPDLAIIDLQSGFMSPGGSFDKLGDDITKYQAIKYQAIISTVQRLHQRAKTLRIPVFFSQAIRERSGVDMLYKQHKILPEKRRERIKRVPLCIRNTWDSDIIDELMPADDDLIVQKRRDSIFQDTE